MTSTERRSAVFVIQLIQDIPVLRPLIFMAAQDFGWHVLLLVSSGLVARDTLGIWRSELQGMAATLGIGVEVFNTDWQAHQHLTDQGILFAASESTLAEHSAAHRLFTHAPASYIRITVQHGFECVGFRQGNDHHRTHGSASFAADILCAWFEPHRLTSMARSQRAKVITTGPTTILQCPEAAYSRGSAGLVCENLHSARFRGPHQPKRDFIRTFIDFCGLMAKRQKRVTLRPHPGGQYFLKNTSELPANVDIANAPTYRLDLRRFAYGISAPSSVLIDLLLAGIPTAVWCDREGRIDTGNYEGLTTVSSVREWMKFVQSAEQDPQPFLARQEEFLRSQEMPLEPRDVYSRYAQLFEAAEQMPFSKERDVARHN